MARYKRILTGEPVPRSIQQTTFFEQPSSPPPPATSQAESRPGTIQDPRPDLAEDSGLWPQVFTLALALDVKAKRNKALFAALHGMRIHGTRLVKSEKTGKLVFRPLIGKDAWASETEYKQAADEYLRPFDQDMKELLRQLNRGDVGAETRENCPWGGGDGKLATTINNLNAGQINIYDLVEEDSE